MPSAVDRLGIGCMWADLGLLVAPHNGIEPFPVEKLLDVLDLGGEDATDLLGLYSAVYEQLETGGTWGEQHVEVTVPRGRCVFPADSLLLRARPVEDEPTRQLRGGLGGVLTPRGRFGGLTDELRRAHTPHLDGNR
jgi:hypothetical protein